MQLYVNFESKPLETTPEFKNTFSPQPFSGQAMIDCGATSCFIHPEIVLQYHLPKFAHEKPKKLKVIDGREVASGLVTHFTRLQLRVKNHTEELECHIADVGNHHLVLGMSWLKRHNPQIDWKERWITFTSHYCDNNCLSIPTVLQLNAAEEDIPEPYRHLSKVFLEQEAVKLPPHSKYDLAIDLVPGTVPKHSPIYPTGPTERAAIKEMIDRQLAAGLIQPSKSPMAAPTLCVKKKDGSIRVCQDYRKANADTIKNVAPLPLPQVLIEQLRGKRIFTKLDLKWGYNLIRIREGDEWKTAFKTKFGMFEWLVMSFGLTNAPAAFQSMMNDIFRDMLGVNVVIYIDDILIFSDNVEEHIPAVQEVLKCLIENNLYCNFKKCSFHVNRIDYLGLIASDKGVEVDQEKVTKAMQWSPPRNVKNVQEFLGFVNFYRRFIPNFAKVARPLYDLLKKDTKFIWSPLAQESFEALKNYLTSAPLLIQPNVEEQFFIECDASDFATGAILLQKNKDGKLCPVAYLSKSLSPTERNYNIFDKELLAIIRALKEWRHLLEGSSKPIQVLTDHKNLEYFKKSQNLNRRQICWLNFLVDYNFEIIYRPGTHNRKADILSRRYDLVPSEGGVKPQVLLKPELLIAAITPDQEIHNLIREALLEDSRLEEVLGKLHDRRKVEGYELREGLLMFKGKIFVPCDETVRNLILESRHDALAAGHPGQARTLELIARTYFWPLLKKSVNSYVSHCETCIWSKPTNQLPTGLLRPLQIPERPWEEIAYDLIIGLPKSEGFDAILTVVNRFSKMVHYIPTKSNATSIDVTNLFVTYMWKLHGLPKVTVMDRGSVFNSKFLKQLYKRLDIKPSFSTAYHPETDGQSERANQVVEIFICAFTNHRQLDWVSLLPMAEFAYNNHVQTSTGKSPFQICQGFNPRFAVGEDTDYKVPNADDHAKFLNDGYDKVKAALVLAQEQHKHFYDCNHRAPEEIEEGDKVWLSHQNISTDRPSIKLSHKKLGPYEVVKEIGSHAYQLKLPHTMRIHPVFHTALLKKSHPDPHGRDPPQPPPIVTEEGEEEYEVEEVVNSCKKPRKPFEYYVKWKGYDQGSNTWEPLEHLEHAKEAIAKYHQKNPRAPRP